MATSVDPVRFVQVLHSVVGASAALHEPLFRGQEWAYVKECLDTGWVSTAGKFVERFESMLAEFTGVPHAAAVVNGTAALHGCLLGIGVLPGDEVLTQPLTFAATCSAIAYCGATPHFVDISATTLGLCPQSLRRRLEDVAEIRDGACRNRHSGRRIAAVVCMHTYGHIGDMDELLAVCRDWSIPLVEDAAEALGSYYKGRHAGHWGMVSALSFNGNKIITTGGGGAILTADPELARKIRHFTTTAKIPHRWEFDHDMVGYNYRLPNLNAALGCAQMEALPAYMEAKRVLARRYDAAFQDVAGLSFFREPEDRVSNYWLNVVMMDDPDRAGRDVLLAAANDAGLMSRPAWKLMHHLAPYADAPRADLPVAERVYDGLINIPSGVLLGERAL